jgi:hypothetical protein
MMWCNNRWFYNLSGTIFSMSWINSLMALCLDMLPLAGYGCFAFKFRVDSGMLLEERDSV